MTAEVAPLRGRESVCLEARALSFAYGPGRARGAPAPAVVRDLSLAIGQAEMVGVLGPNGAGKTTLLRLLAGILPPRAGTVSLFGSPVRSLPARQRARLMAFVPQDSRPAFDFNVLELVLMGRSPHLGLLGIEGRRDVDIAREALSFTDAAAFASRSIGSLSAGERQRVLLARALAQQARVVLLDEPTAFLDIGHQAQILELLERLRMERGVTIVMASHDLNLTGRACDRLILMREGVIEADGPPVEVLTAQRIGAVYGVRASVLRDPEAGPVVVAKGVLQGGKEP